MASLKPCPFCGRAFPDLPYGDYIRCPDCWLPGGSVRPVTWNRRPYEDKALHDYDAAEARAAAAEERLSRLSSAEATEAAITRLVNAADDARKRATAAEEREREAIQAIDVLIHVSPENMALTAESTGKHVAAWEAVRTLVRTRSAR